MLGIAVSFTWTIIFKLASTQLPKLQLTFICMSRHAQPVPVCTAGTRAHPPRVSAIA